MKNLELTESKFINKELPYKLNVLYTFIYWKEIYNLWKDLDEVNYNAILNSTLEASILFGRQLLQLFGIGFINGIVSRINPSKDDIDIINLNLELINIDDDIINQNIDELKYLYLLANKRVAHTTEVSYSLPRTDQQKIIKAILAIHDLIEKSTNIDKDKLLRYNISIALTT